MRRFLTCLGLAAILGMFSLPVRAQLPPAAGRPRTFYIHGTIRREGDNAALERLKVDLRTIGDMLVASTMTQSNGDFDFTGLPNGVYYVIVEAKDYEPVRQQVEIFNAPRPGVAIFLRQEARVALTAPAAVVSARELGLPRKAREALQKGMERLYAKNDLPGSLAEFERAVRVLPTYYEAYAQMGVAYMRLGQNDQAEQSLRKSIELSQGRYPEAFFLLASLFSNTERFTEAEPLARQGLQLESDAWRGYYELARAQFGQNHVEDAARSAGEALARHREFPDLYLVLANIHIRQRNAPALLGDLDAFLKLEPNGPHSEQARQARDQVQRAIAEAQKSPPAPLRKP